MVPEVEVVDDQDVDPRHAEALQAVLVGAHDAVIAVVAAVLELQPARPAGDAVDRGRARIDRRPEDAADLGREQELVPRLAIEEAADPVLALAAAVPGRRVVVADAAVPGRGERRLGVGLGHLGEELAKRRAAEAELGEHDVRAAELSELEGIHRKSLWKMGEEVSALRQRRSMSGDRGEAAHQLVDLALRDRVDRDGRAADLRRADDPPADEELLVHVIEDVAALRGEPVDRHDRVDRRRPAPPVSSPCWKRFQTSTKAAGWLQNGIVPREPRRSSSMK